MTDSVQAALVDFTNNGDTPLTVSVIVNDTEHHVATLEPGESVRQVTPGHVEWCFSPADTDASGVSDRESRKSSESLAEPGDDEQDKGGGKGIQRTNP